MMWSSDYPHLAATFPRSQQFIGQTFGSMVRMTRSLKVSGQGILLIAPGWNRGFSAFWATL